MGWDNPLRKERDHILLEGNSEGVVHLVVVKGAMNLRGISINLTQVPGNWFVGGVDSLVI